MNALEITFMSFARGVEEDEEASQASGRVVRYLTDEHIVTLRGRVPDGPEVGITARASGGDNPDICAAGQALIALRDEAFRVADEARKQREP